jgi:hypothetical protein
LNFSTIDTLQRLGLQPPRRAVRAMLRMRRGLLRLADLLSPTQLALFDKTTGHSVTMALAVAVRLGLPDALAEGPRSSEALAGSAAHADAVGRLLSLLAAHGVFRRLPDGRWANTRLSAALRRDAPHSMAAWAEYMGMGSTMGAWAALEGAVRSGESAFDATYGQSVWERFAAVPEEGAVFAAAMGAVTELDAPGVAAALPMEGIGTLCDVAGGRGTLLAAILEHHRGARGVLFDSAETLSHARPYLAKRRLLSRVDLREGSFFDAVPAGADAFVLKDILHDWDDARCATILGNVRRAARPGGKLFVVEIVVEPHETEVEPRFADVQMLVVCGGGKQRSRAQFGTMLGEAGWALREVRETPFFPSVLVGEAT